MHETMKKVLVGCAALALALGFPRLAHADPVNFTGVLDVVVDPQNPNATNEDFSIEIFDEIDNWGELLQYSFDPINPTLTLTDEFPNTTTTVPLASQTLTDQIFNFSFTQPYTPGELLGLQGTSQLDGDGTGWLWTPGDSNPVGVLPPISEGFADDQVVAFGLTDPVLGNFNLNIQTGAPEVGTSAAATPLALAGLLLLIASDGRRRRAARPV